MHVHNTMTSIVSVRSAAVIGAVALAALLGSMPAIAQHDGNHEPRHKQQDAKPINAMCPIGKEPIVPSAGTAEYKGKTIGLCCPSCGKEFMAWPEAKRDEFVRLALLGKEPGHDQHSQPAAKQADEIESDLYLLDTCPVSGQKLGSMGDPVVKKFTQPGVDRFPHFAGEREVRFCCAGCVKKFEADKEKYFAEIDEKMIEQQLPYYPLDTCVVMGNSLTDEAGKDIAVNLIYQNRLVRFCCRMCVREFNRDPQKFLTKLDEAVIEKQREHYPLQTCAVMEKSKLGSMGEPVEKVYGNWLVKFCCAACIEEFEKNPTALIQRLEAAWKAHGHIPADRGADHTHGGNHGTSLAPSDASLQTSGQATAACSSVLIREEHHEESAREFVGTHEPARRWQRSERRVHPAGPAG